MTLDTVHTTLPDTDAHPGDDPRTYPGLPQAPGHAWTHLRPPAPPQRLSLASGAPQRLPLTSVPPPPLPPPSPTPTPLTLPSAPPPPPPPTASPSPLMCPHTCQTVHGPCQM